MKTPKHIKYIKSRIKSDNSNIARVAKELGVSRQWLHKIITDNLYVGKTMSIRINKWSNGKVSILEAMGIE